MYKVNIRHVAFCWCLQQKHVETAPPRGRGSGVILLNRPKPWVSFQQAHLILCYISVKAEESWVHIVWAEEGRTVWSHSVLAERLCREHKSPFKWTSCVTAIHHSTPGVCFKSWTHSIHQPSGGLTHHYHLFWSQGLNQCGFNVMKELRSKERVFHIMWCSI